MKLTNDNYYSLEANKVYMSSTQFKDFMKCEKEGKAKALGELVEPKTDALLFGGYVDAYFSGELEQFKAQNQDMFNTRTGELKAPFKNIQEVIDTIESDELLLQALSGEKQKIFVGEISGVPFKIKIDSYFENRLIVDQKIIKDLDLLWVEQNGKNVKTDFVSAYGYDIQMAIYQEIVRQNTGLVLPCVLAITTKQECPDKALLKIDQVYLDRALEIVKALAPRYAKIKNGEIEPLGCGKCPTCRKGKKLDGITLYSAYFHKTDLGEE